MDRLTYRDYEQIQVKGLDIVGIGEKNADILSRVIEKLSYYEDLEEQGSWIQCSEGMPKERDSIFAKFKGTSTWNNAMFEKISDDVNVTIEFPNGERMTRTMHTTDGKWNLNFRSTEQKIVAWQPLPTPFKEANSK